MSHKYLSRIGTIVVTLWSFWSCSTTKEDETIYFSLDDFKTVDLAAGEKWSGAPDDNMIGVVYAQGDQYMISMPMDTFKYHFYDKDLKFLYKRVAEGGGPNDFVAPEYFGQWKSDGKGGVITAIVEYPKAQIKTVSPDTEDATVITSIPVGYSIRPYFMISDEHSIIYGINTAFPSKYEAGCRFKYNPSTDSLLTVAPTLKISSQENKYRLFQTGTAASDDCSLFVTVYLHEPLIELWNNNLETVRVLRVADEKIVDEYFDSSDPKYFFRGMQIVGEHIYVLYSNQPYFSKNDCWLLVFDKKGAPQYKMNVGTPYWFTVNPEESTLITTSRDENMEPEVYIYSLPSYN